MAAKFLSQQGLSCVVPSTGRAPPTNLATGMCLPDAKIVASMLMKDPAIHLNSTAPAVGQPQRPQKVGFVSLGCPKNLVDSEVMMGLLARAGAELTTRAEDADVIVVNTCSFIDSAQQESVNTILEMAAHKNGGRAQEVVVAGWLGERFREQIPEHIPQEGAVVGPGQVGRILGGSGFGSVAPPHQSPLRGLPYV